MNQSEETLKELEKDRFECDLMRAMRRVDAPQGFADRVMAATATATPRAKVIAMRPTARAWLSGAIAAGLVTGVFFAEQTHLRHRREEMAQQQFEVALRITDRALEHTREQLARSGAEFGD